jgi:outer membrane immunogenic protein
VQVSERGFFEFDVSYLGLSGDAMIKQLIVTAVALGTVTFSGAHAADLPLAAKAPPLPPPVWTWTGCYGGIEGGGVMGTDRYLATTGANTGKTVSNVTSSNATAGGTIGCNYQFYRYFVVGIEDDISWNGLRGTAPAQKPFPATNSYSVSGNWLDTLRGRAGFVTWDNAFIYATGGAAFGGIQNSVSSPGGISASTNSTATGWTAGGGVEFMPFPNWSLKVEYLFVQFPTINDAFNTAPPVGHFIGVNNRLSENVIRAGLNWHFNWWPVAGGI